MFVGVEMDRSKEDRDQTRHLDKKIRCEALPIAVILVPAHPASFGHNIVSGMQSFYFS